MAGDITCSIVRSELDFDRLEPQQLLSLEGHIRICKECTLWRAQVVSLSTGMQNLEEHDVPATLTNKILNSIENFSLREKQIPTIWIYSVLSAAALVYMSSAGMLDGVDSPFSWLASLLILVACKFVAEKTHKLPEKKLG
jgi:hypothetical protein